MWSSLAKKSLRVAQFIENPNLLRLKRGGGIVDLFLMLNKPWFTQMKFATILDIGASKGYYAYTLSHLFPQAYIYSFEPLADSFAELEKRMAGIQGFRGFNVGLGQENGVRQFHRSKRSTASSFLAMTETHKSAFPDTAETWIEDVQVARLDDLMRSLPLPEPVFVKIDVQGFENAVLQGGQEVIRKAKVVVVEASFERLYDDQWLFDDLYAYMKNCGFYFAGLLDEHAGIDGRVVQADAIFISG